MPAFSRLSARLACSWKAAKSPRGQRLGGRERLQRHRGALEFAIDVPGQVLRHLQHPPFDFLFLETCHLLEGEEREGHERQSQCQREQDQECSDPLGRNGVVEQSPWHEDLAEVERLGIR